jgi:hypothetical protein
VLGRRSRRRRRRRTERSKRKRAGVFFVFCYFHFFFALLLKTAISRPSGVTCDKSDALAEACEKDRKKKIRNKNTTKNN